MVPTDDDPRPVALRPYESRYKGLVRVPVVTPGYDSNEGLVTEDPFSVVHVRGVGPWKPTMTPEERVRFV